jgi:hypothetical protein
VDADRDQHPGSQTPVQPRSWSEVTICFLSDERVQITVGTATEIRNYTEMGFASKKNGTAVQAWDVLRVLARQGGLIQIADDSTQWAVLEKRIQEIRRTLKAVFHLTDDPIRFVKKNPKTRDTFGYHANFKISCHFSIDS